MQVTRTMLAIYIGGLFSAAAMGQTLLQPYVDIKSVIVMPAAAPGNDTFTLRAYSGCTASAGVGSALGKATPSYTATTAVSVPLDSAPPNTNTTICVVETYGQPKTVPTTSKTLNAVAHPVINSSTGFLPGTGTIQGTLVVPSLAAVSVAVCITDLIPAPGQLQSPAPAICSAPPAEYSKQTTHLAVFSSTPAGGGVVTTSFNTQVNTATGTFSGTLASLLTAKEFIELVLLDPTGTKLSSASVCIPDASIQPPKLVVQSTFTTANKTISGTVSMPIPLVPLVPAAGSALPIPNNYPLIAVCVSDPVDTGTHAYDPRCRNPDPPAAPLHSYLADLVSGTNTTALSLPAISSPFSVQLNTALTPGQFVSVMALPPPGYTFSGTQQAVTPYPPQQVRTALAVNQPIIVSGLAEASTSLSGIATFGTDIGVIVSPVSDQHFIDARWRTDGVGKFGPCISTDRLSDLNKFSLSYSGLDVFATLSNSTAQYVPVSTNGSFNITLSSPLTSGEQVQIVQIFPAGTLLPDGQHDLCNSPAIAVPNSLDWGLIRAYFTAGAILSNDSSGFSQANQFFALDVEKTWLLPGCSVRVDASATLVPDVNSPAVLSLAKLKDMRWQAARDASQAARYSVGLSRAANSAPESNRAAVAKQAADAAQIAAAKAAALSALDQQIRNSKKSVGMTSPVAKADKHLPGVLPEYGCLSNRVNVKGDPALLRRPTFLQRHAPGFSSYFETRFTAIPVSTVNAASPGGATPTGTFSSTTATPNILTTIKTIRVGGGAYMPILFTRWNWQHQPNALFVAPLAKIGFDSLAAPTSQSVVASNGATSMATYEQIYNYHSYGARIGHMQMSNSRSRAPELFSYLDIVFGPYSNLESLICEQSTNSKPAYTPTGSACANQYPNFFPAGQVRDSRKRLNRLDLEGLLKIPSTPLYLGFNANIGQHEIGAAAIDPAFSAPDDVRIFFGTKFDIASFLQKLNLGPH